MNKIFSGIILSFIPVLTYCQNNAPDMTVFGYKIGEPLPISECKCEVKEETYLGGTRFHKNIFKYYQYIDNSLISSDCLERINIDQKKVKKKEDLPSLPPITKGTFDVVFAHDHVPQMCPLGSFKVVLFDSKLIGASFIINTTDAGHVMGELKKKYGTNYTIKKYKLQNGYGASIDYYIATWRFADLIVSLSSSTAQTLNDPYGEVDIMLPSKDNNQSQNNRGL